MGAGKIIALIGAIVGLVSVVLSFIAPQIFSWYRIEISMLGVTGGYYITGIGTFSAVLVPPLPDGIAILELIGGIVLIIGAVVCIIGAAKELKAAGIIGGILILLGPLLLIIDLLIGISDFGLIIDMITGVPGTADTLFWGSFSPAPGVLLSWGIWIGAFIALAGGALGLIGGASL